MHITITRCTLADVALLKKISWDTFYEAFIPNNPESDMLAYMNTAFSEAQLRKELQHPESAFYFAKVGEQVVGYLKINVGTAQHEALGDSTLEIERPLY